MSINRMRKNMQSWFRPFMLVVAFVFTVGIVLMMAGVGGSGRRAGPAAQGLLAKVNGEKIDRQTFEPRFWNRIEEMSEGRMLSAFEEAQVRGQMFDELVDRMLSVQAAKKEKVKVSGREVKAKVNEIVDDQLKQMKDIVLAGRKGKKTDKDFEAELKKRGLSLRKLKADIRKSIDADMVREQLLVEKLVEKLKKSVKVSDKAVRESYDEVELSQITITTAERSEAQAEQRAKELVEKLRKGADFAALAKEHSEDPYKASGGKHGFFMRRAYMEEELANAAFALEPGEISDPVKTPQGFVIVRLDERRSALPEDFSDPKKKKQYKEAYLAMEQSRVLREYFQNLHETAKIEIHDAELRGYLLVKELATSFGPSAPDPKAQAEKAVEEFRKALDFASGASQPTARACAQIAYLYEWMRKPGLFSATEEERVEYRAKEKQALEDALRNTESNDLRLMRADIRIEEADWDGALEDLEMVSENAFYDEDYGTHMKLLRLCEKIKGSEKAVQLVAQEREWLDDYDKRMREERAAGQFDVPVRVPAGSEASGD